MCREQFHWHQRRLRNATELRTLVAVQELPTQPCLAEITVQEFLANRFQQSDPTLSANGFRLPWRSKIVVSGREQNETQSGAAFWSAGRAKNPRFSAQITRIRAVYWRGRVSGGNELRTPVRVAADHHATRNVLPQPTTFESPSAITDRGSRPAQYVFLAIQ